MVFLMSNSAQAVKDKLRSIAKSKNIEFNVVLRFYMYDRFVERLSKSKYKENFILKGGFYLSNLFGIEERSTMDIDAAVKNTTFDKNNLINIIKEIIKIDISDNVEFEIGDVSTIRDEDEYGGYRITLHFKLDSIKDKFHIDLATGDPIYPGPDEYKYESLITSEHFNVLAYSIETVIAEKLESILSKKDSSSRMKDYYDIYLIYKFKYDKLNVNKIKMAIKKTFDKRKFNDDIFDSLNIIKNSNELKIRWNSYKRKNKYASNIELDETINCIENFIKLI